MTPTSRSAVTTHTAQLITSASALLTYSSRRCTRGALRTKAARDTPGPCIIPAAKWPQVVLSRELSSHRPERAITGRPQYACPEQYPDTACRLDLQTDVWPSEWGWDRPTGSLGEIFSGC